MLQVETSIYIPSFLPYYLPPLISVFLNLSGSKSATIPLNMLACSLLPKENKFFQNVLGRQGGTVGTENPAKHSS